MLLLYYNQVKLAAECEKALYDLGPFHLKPGYEHLKKPWDSYPGKEIEDVETMTLRINAALGVNTSTETTEESLIDIPLPRPSVEFIAEQVYKQNDIHYLDKDDRTIVRGLGKEKYIVDLKTFTCECSAR